MFSKKETIVRGKKSWCTFPDLEVNVGDQETRLTVVEENIQSIIILAFFYGLERLLNLTVLGIYVFYSVLFLFLALQITDVDLNERLTALEDKENSNI